MLTTPPAFADGDTTGQPVHERCATCHELDGNARGERLPRLAGQTVDYLVKQLQDFRGGRRVSSMQATAELLSDDEIAAVARHFAEQAPRAPAETITRADQRRAERLHREGGRQRGLRACGSCHGPHGEGDAARPRLAGQHPGYLEAQLLAFAQGKRDGGAMRDVARALTAPERRSLARYFASLDRASPSCPLSQTTRRHNEQASAQGDHDKGDGPVLHRRE
jgi:cytochrome c553